MSKLYTLKQIREFAKVYLQPESETDKCRVVENSRLKVFLCAIAVDDIIDIFLDNYLRVGDIVVNNDGVKGIIITKDHDTITVNYGDNSCIIYRDIDEITKVQHTVKMRSLVK